MMMIVASRRIVLSCRSRFVGTRMMKVGGVRRNMADLPPHLVMGMPALSPTMEAGTIASWRVAKGDSFVAGDSIAEIETDKATIEFEAQDDGVVAKLLAEPGTEINVGVPIIIVVEDPDDVAAFDNYEPPSAAAADQPKKEDTAPPAPLEEIKTPPSPPASPPNTKASPPKPEASSSNTKASPKDTEADISPPPAVAKTEAPTVGPAWGNLAKVKSPLAHTLAAKQKRYIELYGSTGQLPL